VWLASVLACMLHGFMLALCWSSVSYILNSLVVFVEVLTLKYCQQSTGEGQDTSHNVYDSYRAKQRLFCLFGIYGPRNVNVPSLMATSPLSCYKMRTRELQHIMLIQEPQYYVWHYFA
jgi:hypothetical protein